MFALILDERVVDTSDAKFEVAPQLKWVECNHDVTTGYTYKEGVFTAPPEPTVKDPALIKIHELETQVTARRAREATLGDAESIAFIKDINDQIAIERAKLSAPGG